MEESIAPVSAFELDYKMELWNRVDPLDPITYGVPEHRIRPGANIFLLSKDGGRITGFAVAA